MSKVNPENNEDHEDQEENEEEVSVSDPGSHFPVDTKRKKRNRHRMSISHDKKCLQDFKRFTLRSSDGEEGKQKSPKDRSREAPTQPSAKKRQRVKSTLNVEVTIEPSAATSNADKKEFIQFDLLAMIIVVLFCLAIIALVMDIWCYEHDSYWNSVVMTEQPFQAIPEETFFSGKYLVVYEDDPSLFHAKQHLLRDNRWLEVDHIIFLVVFLITTFVQFAIYITRGKENHMQIIVFYFAFVGAMGIIISFFPVLSWNAMQVGYGFAVEHLTQFAQHQLSVSLADDSIEPGELSKYTAYDALIIAGVTQHCRDASQIGSSGDADAITFTAFNRRYTLSDLQDLGFCTHYEYKIASSIITFVFSLLCGVIPCLYCGDRPRNRGDQEVEPLDMYTKESVSSLPGLEGRVRPQKKHRHPPKTHPQKNIKTRSRERGGMEEKQTVMQEAHELNEIERWKHFINEGE